MTTSNQRLAAVAAGAAILIGFGSFGAVASGMITSDDIKNGSIHQADIARDAVGSGKVEDGSLKLRDIDPATVTELQGPSFAGDALRGEKGEKGDTGPAGPAGAQGPTGPQGPKGDSATLSANSSSDGLVPVTYIGGRFGERATQVDTFTLPAGTHRITTDGFFTSTATTSGLTRLQVAVRAGGQDLGTCFTGAASPLAGREATCSTTRVVTLDAPTDVTVYVFGYADDQGSADSGKFAAYTTTSALQVG